MRGGGDLATGIVYRLHKAGFPVVVLELKRPLPVRRRVAVATAILEKQNHHRRPARPASRIARGSHAVNPKGNHPCHDFSPIDN